VIVLRVLAKDRKLDSLLFKQAGIIRAEDLKQKALVPAFFIKGFFPFRQGADFVLGKKPRLGDEESPRAFHFLPLLILIVFRFHFPFWPP